MRSWCDAPAKCALLRKAIDDEVKVEVPGGAKTYYVAGVRYEKRESSE